MNVEKTFNYKFKQCLCPGINEGIKLQVINHKNVTKQRLSIFFADCYTGTNVFKSFNI